MVPPRRPPPPAWVGSMAMAQLALWLGLYAPLKTLVPLLAAQIAAGGADLGPVVGFGPGLSPGLSPSKEALLAAVTLAGSLVAVVATPLAGSLCDRSRGRWGQRSTWVGAGSLGAALAIGLLPQARSGLALLLLWGLANLGLAACLAGLHGSAADRVPMGEQGSLWGWVGLAQPLGLVLGVGLCSLLLPQLQLAAWVLAALLVAANGPYLALERRQPAKTLAQARFEIQPLGQGTISPSQAAARSPSQSPRLTSPQRWPLALAAFRHGPFARLWISRFLLYLGWSISTVYLLYFLEDRLGLAQARALEALTLLLALYAGATALASALAGPLSDRLGRRLPLVWVGTGGMALACALMLISQSLPLALVGASLLGLAYGTYGASHQALVVEQLPSGEHHGRDLGLFNGANSAAMVVSPVLAWALVSGLGGYGSLFLAATLLILISALPLLRLGE
ncbi:MAG: MFS transporter [Cyanobacteria bacterium]|nr:MFS transporter [Cyanobacteriota bacterium]